jgi:hypothetical protein
MFLPWLAAASEWVQMAREFIDQGFKVSVRNECAGRLEVLTRVYFITLSGGRLRSLM